MPYLILFILVFPLMVTARENPFAPMQESDTVQVKEQNLTTPAEIQRSESGMPPEQNADDKLVVNYGKARFVFRENSAYIETKDEIIKHFSISNPPSIIIDFRSPSDFASKRKALATSPFIKLEMGAHDDYYRVVLRLDKVRSYSVEKRKYGQLVTAGD